MRWSFANLVIKLKLEWTTIPKNPGATLAFCLPQNGVPGSSRKPPEKIQQAWQNMLMCMLFANCLHKVKHFAWISFVGAINVPIFFISCGWVLWAECAVESRWYCYGLCGECKHSRTQHVAPNLTRLCQSTKTLLMAENTPSKTIPIQMDDFHPQHRV